MAWRIADFACGRRKKVAANTLKAANWTVETARSPRLALSDQKAYIPGHSRTSEMTFGGSLKGPPRGKSFSVVRLCANRPE
jgi:hypothetical protein